MLIEPTPALPPSSGRRARLAFAILAPVAILVAVIGVGMLGARDGDVAIEMRGTTPPASVDPPSTAPAVASVEPDRPPAFPSRVLGLTTRTVTDALERRRNGTTADEIVAVRGFATVHPTPTDCFVVDDAPTIADALACRRDVIIADVSDPFLAWRDEAVARIMGGRVTHLHAAAFPVVSLVDLEVRTVVGPSIGAGDGPVVEPIVPVPVVVLGRFGDPRLADPRTSARHPNEAFVIERIVWVDDVRPARPTVRFVPPMSGEITMEEVQAITSNALPGGTVILNHSIASLDVLGRLDAAAVGLARSGARDIGLPEPAAVWYVRVMIRGAPPVDTLAGDTTARRLAWAVMTADGTLLGTGTQD